MNVTRVLALARNDLRLMRSSPAIPIILTLMPLVLMWFFAPAFDGSPHLTDLGSNSGARQAVPGLAILFALYLQGYMTFNVFQEHGWGTWDRLRASMAANSEIAIGKILVPAAVLATQLTLLLVLGDLLFGLGITGPPLALSVVIAAFTVSLVGLGAMWMASLHSQAQLSAANNLGTIVLAGLGGALTPLSALPDWAETVAPATPSYWAMRGFRSVISDGEGFLGVIPSAAVLLLFAVAFFVIAGVRFRFDERKVI